MSFQDCAAVTEGRFHGSGNYNDDTTRALSVFSNVMVIDLQ